MVAVSFGDLKREMKNKKFGKMLLWGILPLGLDQAVKFLLVNKGLGELLGEKVELFAYVCNRGVAFGLEFNKNLIFLFNFLIIGLLVWSARRQESFKGERAAIYLIIGAAISNLLDRIFRGCVVDYFDIKIWPVFNLADCVLVLAIAYWLFGDLFGRKKA